MDIGHVYEEINPCFRGEQYVKDFEISALDNRNGAFELRQFVTKDSIQSYIMKSPEEPGITQILTSRHKDHLRREIRPSFPSYSANLVELLEDFWHIPSTYMQLRTYANACGTFQRYVRRDEQGEVENLSYVLRVPHSPRHIKSIWSLALCWEPKLSRTFALFDGAADADIYLLQRYLNSCPQLQNHPLTLPTILMDILGKYKITPRNKYERLLWEMEVELGITRASSVIGREEHRLSHELDEITSRCNQLTTSIIYLERGQTFIRDLAEKLRQEACIEYCFDQRMDKDAHRRLSIASHEAQDIVENCHNLAVNSIHQISCLEKRAKTLLNIIYILIAQKDSRLSIEVAIATKRDSSIVTAIGVITMIFLPATFVTSLFGMNFFDFDTQTQSIVVSGSFWLYWSIAIPLTVVVLLLFLSWMVWSRSSSRQNRKERKKNNLATDSDIHENIDPRAVLLDGGRPLPELIGPCLPPVRIK